MTNFKTWKKVGESTYAFYKHDEKIGEMAIQMPSFERNATLRIEGTSYVLNHTGFWKNNIEIQDDAGNIVLKTYTEKWYANASVIEFDNKKLKLIVGNNPFAEYAVIDGDKEILAYGLYTDQGWVTARIQTSIHNKSYLLDFLLWYLFVPIAQENMGDSITFTMLLMN